MPQLEELSIEVTNECPMMCIHCSSGSSPKRLPDEISVELQLDLIEQARDMGATVLSLSGGEPLVYPHLMELVRKAERWGYDRILLYTTGHTHEHRWVNQHPLVSRLLSVRNLTWIFSLHSANPAVNDHIMNREGATNHIKDSVSWLVSQGADVEIHMVPMKINFTSIAGLRQWCSSIGVSKMSLLRFVPQTRGAANKDALLMDVPDFSLMQAIMHIQTTMSASPTDLRLGCPIDFRHSLGLVSEKQKPCHAGDDLILVRPDGAAHPCAAWKSLPSDANVRDYSLESIFNDSTVFQAVRHFKYDRGWDRIEGCKDCKYVESCMGGCPAQRLHAYGKKLDALFAAPGDPLCHMVRGNV